MKYIKKPVVIEAVQFTGENQGEIVDYLKAKLINDKVTGKLFILTLEGMVQVNLYDYIIRGVKGETYPCKPDIFEMTYEIVGDAE